MTTHLTKSLRQNDLQKKKEKEKVKARKVDSSNSKSIIIGHAAGLSFNLLKGCAFEKENGTCYESGGALLLNWLQPCLLHPIQ